MAGWSSLASTCGTRLVPESDERSSRWHRATTSESNVCESDEDDEVTL